MDDWPPVTDDSIPSSSQSAWSSASSLQSSSAPHPLSQRRQSQHHLNLQGQHYQPVKGHSRTSSSTTSISLSTVSSPTYTSGPGSYPSPDSYGEVVSTPSSVSTAPLTPLTMSGHGSYGQHGFHPDHPYYAPNYQTQQPYAGQSSAAQPRPQYSAGALASQYVPSQYPQYGAAAPYPPSTQAYAAGYVPGNASHYQPSTTPTLPQPQSQPTTQFAYYNVAGSQSGIYAPGPASSSSSHSTGSVGGGSGYYYYPGALVPPPREERPRLSEQEKKVNHIASEQKRRQAIREGFDRLTEIVPGLEGMGRSEGLVLKRSVEHMKAILEERDRLIKMLEELGAEVPEEYKK